MKEDLFVATDILACEGGFKLRGRERFVLLRRERVVVVVVVAAVCVGGVTVVDVKRTAVREHELNKKVDGEDGHAGGLCWCWRG